MGLVRDIRWSELFANGLGLLVRFESAYGASRPVPAAIYLRLICGYECSGNSAASVVRRQRCLSGREACSFFGSILRWHQGPGLWQRS